MAGDDSPVSLCQEKPVATDMIQRILKALKKETTIAQLSTDFDVSQRVMQAYIDDLIEQGYAIESRNDTIRLCRTVAPQENLHGRMERREGYSALGLYRTSIFALKYQQLTLKPAL